MNLKNTIYSDENRNKMKPIFYHRRTEMDICFKNGSALTCLKSTEYSRGKRSQLLLNKESEYMNYLEQVFVEKYTDKMIKILDKESEHENMASVNIPIVMTINEKGIIATYSQDSKEVITCFEEIVPEQVVVVHFRDGQSEKMVCQEPDVFDLHKCLFLAIAKHLYKKEYTTEGIEYKASELSMQKKYVKIVENAIKAHSKMLKDQEKSEKLELERIAAKNRRLQKKREKREQAKELKREEVIEMQKEAYLRAMKEYKSDKKKEK